MIGEIRDLETAQIAVQASLTGHLVLATLHTNDAAGAVTRLIDMGIEPFLLASSLLGAMAQRLVRKICAQCGAQGCAACGHSGYRGRTGIYELLSVDADLRRMIHDAASEEAIRAHARAHGMTSLREDGARWVADGTTSLEEVLRVTRDSSER
jgi:general secretion pathway protein E